MSRSKYPGWCRPRSRLAISGTRVRVMMSDAVREKQMVRLMSWKS